MQVGVYSFLRSGGFLSVDENIDLSLIEDEVDKVLGEMEVI